MSSKPLIKQTETKNPDHHKAKNYNSWATTHSSKGHHQKHLTQAKILNYNFQKIQEIPINDQSQKIIKEKPSENEAQWEKESEIRWEKENRVHGEKENKVHWEEINKVGWVNKINSENEKSFINQGTWIFTTAKEFSQFLVNTQRMVQESLLSNGCQLTKRSSMDWGKGKN